MFSQIKRHPTAMNSRLTVANVILKDQHSGIISQVHVLHAGHTHAQRRGTRSGKLMSGEESSCSTARPASQGSGKGWSAALVLKACSRAPVSVRRSCLRLNGL